MVDKALHSSDSDEWYTPQEFFDKCSREVGWFDLDPCSDITNAKCPKFFTKEDDWLLQEWSGKVFVNPPYSENNFAYREIEWKRKKIYGWIEKCERERERVKVIYLLIPSRTDTKVFHDFLYQKEWVELRFIKGRLKFGGAKNSAPFPSLLAIFRPSKKDPDLDSVESL